MWAKDWVYMKMHFWYLYVYLDLKYTQSKSVSYHSLDKKGPHKWNWSNQLKCQKSTNKYMMTSTTRKDKTKVRILKWPHQHYKKVLGSILLLFLLNTYLWKDLGCGILWYHPLLCHNSYKVIALEKKYVVILGPQESLNCVRECWWQSWLNLFVLEEWSSNAKPKV